MDLDKPILGASQIAELADTDILNVHTWTTRGFTDPYHNSPKVRRAGGRARTYSIRDALRFYLMARLHKQYRTPMPQGLQISQAVFGEENFNPQTAGYLVVEEGQSGFGGVRWFKNLQTLGRHLEDEPVNLVINVKQILDQVEAGASRFMIDPSQWGLSLRHANRK
jgi:hypothetical protein